eukprot:11223360-Lingulodinium_polyedra.AAC.1
MVAARQRRRRESHLAMQANVIRDWIKSTVGAGSTRRKAATLEIKSGRSSKHGKSGSSHRSTHVRKCLKAGSLRVVFRDRHGQREITPISTMLDAAYDHRRSSLHVKADFHGASKTTIARSCHAAAMAYLSLQGMALQRMLTAFRHSRPSFFIKHLSWDETAQKLSFFSQSGAATTAYEIMVMRCKLIWGWE